MRSQERSMDRKKKEVYGLCSMPLQSFRGWEMNRNYVLCYTSYVLNYIIKKKPFRIQRIPKVWAVAHYQVDLF